MTKTEHRQRKTPLRRKLLLLGAALLVSLALAEIGARIFSRAPPALTFRDAEIGLRQDPGFEGEVRGPESRRPVYLRFHRDGFRGPDRPYAKPAATRRIAVLGDSMVAALDTDEESTWVRQLESMLGEAGSDTRWEVLNFGVSGASTGTELVLYRKLVRRYDPDIVICAFFVGNDFSDNSERLSWYPRLYLDIDERGELFVKPFSATRSSVSEWLNRNSRLYVWQKRLVNDLVGRANRGSGALRGGRLVFLDRARDDVDHGWRLTERLVQQLHAEVTTDRRQFLLVVIPENVQNHRDLWDEFVERYPAESADLDRDPPGPQAGGHLWHSRHPPPLSPGVLHAPHSRPAAYRRGRTGHLGRRRASERRRQSDRGGGDLPVPPGARVPRDPVKKVSPPPLVLCGVWCGDGVSREVGAGR